MIKYAALLRGIGPTNPNMRNDKLKAFFESLGYSNVQTIISSGNIIFESSSNNATVLEEEIEKMLPEKLGFSSKTIIRSFEQIKEITDNNPFNSLEDTPSSRLNVTFLKNKIKNSIDIPFKHNEMSFSLIAATDREIFSVIDTISTQTPDMMRWLEKTFGKEITTRTWKTIIRIFNKLNT